MFTPLKRTLTVASFASFGVVQGIIFNYSTLYSDIYIAEVPFYLQKIFLATMLNAGIISSYVYREAGLITNRYMRQISQGHNVEQLRLILENKISFRRINLSTYITFSIPSRAIALLACTSWISISVDSFIELKLYSLPFHDALVGTYGIALMGIFWIPSFFVVGIVCGGPVMYPLAYAATRIGMRQCLKMISAK